MEMSVPQALELLRLQLEWGADEALEEQPQRRLAPAAPQLRPLQAIDALPGTVAAPGPAPGQAPGQARGAPGRGAPGHGAPGPGAPGHSAEESAAAADSLQALRAAVAGFSGCSLRDTASHTLFAEGDAASGLVLVGEVPDADEDRAGHAFAGAPGILLDRMLASIGLSRDRLLIAPLIPWRPPGDRKVNPAEMAACLPFLHRLLVLVRPSHLVLMGARPARALLLNESPIARLRGRWLPVPGPERQSPPIQALAMRHPSHLLANPPSRREAWHDLLLLRRTLDARPAREDRR